VKLNGIFYILRVTMTYFFVLPAWVCKASVFFERRGWHHLAAHLKAGRRKVKKLNASLAPVDGKLCRCTKGKCHLTKRSLNKHRRLCRAGERCPAQKRLGTNFCTTCAFKTKQGCERGHFLDPDSRCTIGIQGYNATKLPVCQGCSTSHYGLLLGTPLANAKNMLPGGEDATRLLAARVEVAHHDAQQLPVYRIQGRFRGPKDKSDPTKEAKNGGFIGQGDMINHSNPSIQGTPGLVASLMDCVFKQNDELPASDFCCVKVHREANGEVKMLEVQPTAARFPALKKQMAKYMRGLEIGSGEGGETTGDEEIYV